MVAELVLQFQSAAPARPLVAGVANHECLSVGRTCDSVGERLVSLAAHVDERFGRPMAVIQRYAELFGKDLGIGHGKVSNRFLVSIIERTPPCADGAGNPTAALAVERAFRNHVHGSA